MFIIFIIPKDFLCKNVCIIINMEKIKIEMNEREYNQFLRYKKVMKYIYTLEDKLKMNVDEFLDNIIVKEDKY